MQTITVHECEVCGDCPMEVMERDPESDEVVGVLVEGYRLRRCEVCHQLVCESCSADGWCCEIKAERDEVEPALFGEGR